MAALSERERDETVRPHVETTPAPGAAPRAFSIRWGDRGTEKGL